jgi:hypothetical protein
MTKKLEDAHISTLDADELLDAVSVMTDSLVKRARAARPIANARELQRICMLIARDVTQCAVSLETAARSTVNSVE